MTTAVLPDTQRPTIPELLGKLGAIGDPDRIAWYLIDEGIQGTPCNAGSCAIARYLQRETALWGISVGDVSAVIWHSAEESPDEYFELPMVVRDFINNFDQEEYPELLDPERRVHILTRP